MTVDITFQIDGRDGVKTVEVEWPFDSAAKARDKVSSMLDDASSNTGSAMVSVRDDATGNFVYVNTMKLMTVIVEDSE